MYAPSSKNQQPWEFIIVTDNAKLERLSDAVKYWKMLKDAPLAIIVLANLEGFEPLDSGMYVQDCSAATQNILLAAHAIGLGGVWLGLHGIDERVAFVSELFGLPEHIIPFAVLSIGEPAESPEKHTFWHESKVHYETY
jgi:nitroreductase